MNITMNSSPEHPKPYIRLATPEDAEAIADVFGVAFASDPVMNYLGNVQKVCSLAIFQTGEFSAFRSIIWARCWTSKEYY